MQNILIEKKDVAGLLESARYITIGEATYENSGVPIFKRFLNQETVNVLFGPSGSGKSFLTLDLAMSLAAGNDWAGYKCRQKMSVLYVCTESGSSFGKRVVAARRRYGIKQGAPLTEHPFAYYPAHVDLLHNKDHLKLIAKLVDDLERLSGYKCGLVIVDTLSAAFGGGNENGEDMTKFVNNMSEIKYRKKVSVLIVHHTGKNENAGARGHSSLKGNIDSEIQVKSEKRGERYLRSFTSTKQKDDKIGDCKQFGLRVVELALDEDSDPITTCAVVLEDDDGFESVFPKPEDLLAGNKRAAFLTMQRFQKPDFLRCCKGKKTAEIRKLIVKHWVLIKATPQKMFSFDELENAAADYSYKDESSNLSRDFGSIVGYFDKKELTLDQWINEYLVKPAQALSG